MRSIAALCAVVLLVPSWCAADPFNEFRIPAHTWQSGTASFSMNASRYDFALSDEDPRDQRELSGYYGLRAGLERGFDSDRLSSGWAVAAGHQLGGFRSESMTRYRFPPTPVREGEDRWSRTASGDLALSGFVRRYREASELGLDLSASGFARGIVRTEGTDYTLDGFPDGYREQSRRTSRDHWNASAATLAATLGQGVVRNATVVEDVHVLEARLQEAGALDRELTPSTRARLAQLLVVTPRLWNAHDRAGRFAWREVERVLREDGALRDGKFDAYSQLYVLERYRVGPSVRRAVGHFVGLTLLASHEHRLDREDDHTTARSYLTDSLVSSSEYSRSSRGNSERNRLLAGPSVEWHRPIGWRWQWDLSTRVLFAARAGEHGLRTESNVGGAWLVADRWQARAAFQHYREYLDGAGQTGAAPVDAWRVRGVVGLDYFLEDHIQVSAEYREGQDRDLRRQSYFPYRVDHYSREDNFYLGLTYRFLGRVSAPGLMDPMRPL